MAISTSIKLQTTKIAPKQFTSWLLMIAMVVSAEPLHTVEL